MSEPARTRRQALSAFAGGALALWLSSCGAGARATASGSTLQGTWRDETGGGVLRPGAGVPLIDRTELAPRASVQAVLATLAHVTDAHVLDAESPARVPFLARLGAPFGSTFRPQETLTAQVLSGAIRAIDALAPDAVIQGGDLIDNAQNNELNRALAAIRGGTVHPNSGGPGYYGVQWAGDPDPFYYRPDIDAPRHPGLLQQATGSFRARGLAGTPWYPVLGDHDLLVQGVLAPTPLTGAIALGDRAVWELPAGLEAPVGVVATAPDGLAQAAPIQALIERLVGAPAMTITPDPERRELAAAEVLARLRAASGAPARGRSTLDYSFDVGEHLRVIVLDLVRREGGSGGLVHPGQPQWLAHELARAGRRWVLVSSHQPLTSSAGGAALLGVLDGHPRVLAAIWGHTHRNRIVPRPSRGGGYWLISTASLIDYPQQARALQLVATAGGAVALRTWLLDHVGALGDVSRELAYLDAHGGRPQGFAGRRLDGNVTLYLRAP
jgi:3',5'-cyclic AMP phosphodiesterase CpdA